MASTGGKFRCGEYTEYTLDLLLVAADLLIVVLGMWCVRPPPESPLDFGCESKVVRYGQRTGLGLIDTPF